MARTRRPLVPPPSAELYSPDDGQRALYWYKPSFDILVEGTSIGELHEVIVHRNEGNEEEYGEELIVEATHLDVDMDDDPFLAVWYFHVPMPWGRWPHDAMAALREVLEDGSDYAVYNDSIDVAMRVPRGLERKVFPYNPESWSFAKPRKRRRIWKIMQMGHVGPEVYESRAAAQAAADEANAAAEEECGEEIWGDGAACVVAVDEF